MRIILYKFNKKSNSTARPSNSTAKIELDNAQIKTPSSINAPLLQLAKDKDPNGYNYIYIPSFNRYYFVQDITYSIGVWLVSCTVDVLASFKEDILASSQYVLRSASSYDVSILDNLYYAKANSNNGKQYATGSPKLNGLTDIPTYFDGILFTGCFVVQVISSNNSGVTAYALDNTAFRNLIGSLMSYVPSDMSDISNGLAKQLFDPLQYITSVVWYPNFPDKSGTAVTSITFGSYSISISSGTAKYFDSTTWDSLTINIPVPKHPKSSVLNYLQLAPYSRYSLYFEPFGSLELDTTKLYEVDEVVCKWYVEYQKGLSHLEVYDKNNTGNIIAIKDSAIGITIPISQLTVDYIGSATTVVSGAIDAVGEAIKGNVLGAGSSIIGSAIGSAVSATIPTLQTSGTSDSFLIFRGEPPYISYQFIDVVNDDLARYGRPLCQIKTLSTLSGYALCSNAVVDYSTYAPLAVEADEVNSLLNSGVYIE